MSSNPGRSDSLADQAATLARETGAAHGEGHRAVARGERIAGLLTELGADDEIVAAAWLFPLLETQHLKRRDVSKSVGDAVATLTRELVKLSRFGLTPGWEPSQQLGVSQADALRKMLIAIVEDVRLVLVRIADQLCRLQLAKNAPAGERRHVAIESREIFAPLANRLGIWQLKWEMEDLIFRFLEPDTYKRVARLLAERRVDREENIAQVIAEVRTVLQEQGINAEIAGRPKHIYSIYRKMQRKGVGFDQVYDVRAVRVLVDNIAQCYAALGAVHGRWKHIPGEFDDYIATPKGNNYRSLHTAVIGPGAKTLEIQIRTFEMHDHAELGVAAHWKYKEGGGRADPAFMQKINWLRSILEPGEEESHTDLIDRFKSEAFEDRVYALTPDGDIVDLPDSATPLDFAYHVHTDVGHRCRGARVNGRMVPLTHRLVNGDRVEIITAKTAQPSRDWLIPQLGYLASSRARTKVRVWFRKQDQEHSASQGQAIFEREIQRLGVDAPHVSELARDLGHKTATDLYIALGHGDLHASDVAAAVQKRVAPPELPPLLAPRRRKGAKTGAKGDIGIEGVGDLLTTMGKCCKPVPPDPITGYITQGRGITIHRQDCANASRLASKQPERVLEVSWSVDKTQTYPVDVVIEAYDRQGLLKDISTLLSVERVNILSVGTKSNSRTLEARMDLTLEISSLEALSRVMQRINQLPNVLSARRRT